LFSEAERKFAFSKYSAFAEKRRCAFSILLAFFILCVALFGFWRGTGVFITGLVNGFLIVLAVCGGGFALLLLLGQCAG
jgi:uncharacterized membrane protein